MIKEYATQNKEAALQTIRELCAIPAPSLKEKERAEYCKAWLEKAGAKGVYIDEVYNTIFPLNCEGSNEITVLAAHTDTVFPDLTPYPFKEDEEKMYAPGIGDDTANLVSLLMVAKYFIENNIQPKNGVLFVCNAAEEGLGNLVGVRQLMKDYAGRIKQFVSFDANIGVLYDIPVGSHRYSVEVKTEGGHSFGRFGNRNSIHALAEIITEIYKIEVPKKENSITTYNVGVIEGGTSVNTIAQSAKMLCEYRSNDRECLAIMQEKFEKIFKNARNEKTEVLVEKIGDRPCKGEVDEAQMERLVEAYAKAVKETNGQEIKRASASTDANIPLSLGIPAVTVGACIGKGAHTREEWIQKDAVQPSIEIGVRMMLEIIK